MDIEGFIRHFAEQFNYTELSEFKPETMFHELEEYCSLIALSILLMIDKEYGITMDANEVMAAVTIEDLYNKVQAKVQ